MLKNTLAIFVAYIGFALLVAYFFFGDELKGAASIEKMEFYTEDLPPFNYLDSKGEPSGISVAFLDYVLKSNKSKKTIKNVKFLEWDDAYFQAISNDNAVLFSTTRTVERESLFKWAGPLVGVSRAIFVVDNAKNKRVTEKDIAKLKYIVAGNAVADYALLIKSGIPKENIEIAPTIEAAIDALFDPKKKIGAIACNAISLRYILEQGEYKHRKVRELYTLQVFYHYFSFNKKVSDSVVEKFQKAIDEYKKTDDYKEKIAKYLH